MGTENGTDIEWTGETVAYAVAGALVPAVAQGILLLCMVAFVFGMLGAFF